MNVLKSMLGSNSAPLDDEGREEELELLLAVGVEFEQHVHFQILGGL